MAITNQNQIINRPVKGPSHGNPNPGHHEGSSPHHGDIGGGGASSLLPFLLVNPLLYGNQPNYYRYSYPYSSPYPYPYPDQYHYPYPTYGNQPFEQPY